MDEIKNKLMQTYGLTEEMWNEVYTRVYAKRKEYYPNKSEAELATASLNAMKVELLRVKKVDEKIEEIVLLGFNETPDFNGMRIRKTDKLISEFGEFDGKTKAVEEKLMDKDGNYLDNFGGIIDPLNTKNGSADYVYGMDKNGGIFVGAVYNGIDDISFGCPLKIKTKRSKSSKEFYGVPQRYIEEIIETGNTLSEKELRNFTENMMKIMDKHVAHITTDSDVQNNLNSQVLVSGLIYDISPGPFGTSIGIYQENTGHMFTVKLSPKFEEFAMKFIADSVPLTVIGSLGKYNDDSESNVIYPITMVCAESDLIITQKVEEKEVKVEGGF